MENIYFLILVAVIGLVRWIAQMAENKRNADAARRAGTASAESRPNAPVERAPAQSEEERIRKFMEALGMPTDQPPPPPVQPTAVMRAPEARTAPAQPQPQERRRTFAPPPVDPFPRPVFQRPTVVVEPRQAPAPPPLPAAPPPPLPTRETSVLVEQASRTTASAAPEFTVQDIDEAAAEAALTREARRASGAAIVTSPVSLVERLSTHEGLRDAMVLREIFGPPRSMEPLERSVR
jgi:hypothetical protein